MWPFDRTTTTARPIARAEPAPLQGSEPSAVKLAELGHRVADLEREWKAVEVEWISWFDKYRRLYGRIAKRAEREEADHQDDATQSRHDAPEGTNGAGGHRYPSRAPPTPSAHLAARFRR